MGIILHRKTVVLWSEPGIDFFPHLLDDGILRAIHHDEPRFQRTDSPFKIIRIARLPVILQEKLGEQCLARIVPLPVTVHHTESAQSRNVDERRLPDLLAHGEFVQRAPAPFKITGIAGGLIGCQKRLRCPEHRKAVLLVHGVALDLLAQIFIPSPPAARPIGFEILPATLGDDLLQNRIHGTDCGIPIFSFSGHIRQL